MKKRFFNFLFIISLSFILVFLILLNCSTEVIYEEPKASTTTLVGTSTSTTTSIDETTTTTTEETSTSTSTSSTTTTTYVSTSSTTTTTVLIVYYKVTYDGNANTGGDVPIDSTNYEDNELVTVLANTGNLVKTGYIFGGWNTKADGTGTNYTAGSGTFNIISDTTLYAKWNSYSYTVTFDSDGGTPVTSTKTVASPATTVGTLPTNPTKSGFYFAGWFTEKIGAGTQFMANTIVTGSLTVYANWSSTVKYFLVFNVDGGSPVDTQYIDDGGLATEPTAPTKTGYTFDGWYKEETFQTLWNFGSYIVTADTTIYAKWIQDLGDASVTINIIAPEQFYLTFGGTSDLILDKNIPESLTVTVSLDGAESIWKWYLDGDLISAETDNTCLINSGSLEPGLYRLDVVGTKNGLQYSGYIQFEVVN